MVVDRLLPSAEGAELVSLVREFAQAELAPRAAGDEAAERFPRDAFTRLGQIGLLGLPYPEAFGGAAQPYEVYLQALEEVASAWMSVGVGVSVHVMASYAMAAYGTPDQLDPLSAGDGRRPDARRVRVVRGSGRFGHLRDDRPGETLATTATS